MVRVALHSIGQVLEPESVALAEDARRGPIINLESSSRLVRRKAPGKSRRLA